MALPSWLSAECELAYAYWETAGALWDSWRQYAKANGAEPGSPAEFAQIMERRGFEADRFTGERHRIRWGLRLRRHPPAPEAPIQAGGVG
ncbi:hypothetical protein [Sphingomonas arenae]|uniref:hypothetical protein n=1 Tax=Sphingomonas arenae TaxID=2812555 RepID=UPI001968087C|nr:hypothetical protein [Sphingomonas arenae]